jgi:hypothetical protein
MANTPVIIRSSGAANLPTIRSDPQLDRDKRVLEKGKEI